MANVSEKKKKLLYLLQILLEKTDGEHALTLPELLQELEDRGISAERKSIYDDIETLRSIGVEIDTRKNKTFQYYVEKRRFSFEELRLLAEAAHSAPFISEKQAGELTAKLGTLCSAYQAQELQQRKEPQKAPVEEQAGEKITLEFSSGLTETVSERFGTNIKAEQVGKNRMRAAFRTETGETLFAWLFSQGTEVRLVSPKKLAEQFRERAKALAKMYKS